MDTKTKPFLLKHKIDVKPYDIDLLGHVNNTVYIRWLEDTRVKILDEYLPYKNLMQKNISPILLKTEIEYKRPVKIFDELFVEAYFTKIDGIRMEMYFEFIVDDKIVAVAKQLGTFFNIKRNRPCKPPKEFLDQFNKNLD